jgi:hypothetical protein
MTGYVANTGDLFRWQNAVFADASLSQGAKVVAVRLINHLNLRQDGKDGRPNPLFGLCNPAVDTIATATGMTRRGVQLIIARLIAGQWIDREVMRGRMHSNRYRFRLDMVPDQQQAGPEPENANTHSHISSEPVSENANGGTLKCERPCRKMRTPVRPISKNNYNLTRARAVGAPDGADRLAASNLGTVGARLQQRLGAPVYESWLSKMEIVSTEGDLLTLSVPTTFLRSYVTAHFESAILECWRSEQPNIKRLNIVITAPVTAISSRRNAPVTLNARWLLDVGRLVVRDRLGVSSTTAQKTIIHWLEDSGNDADGVATVISAADAQNLSGDQFRNVVGQKIRDLARERAGPPLPFGPTPVKGGSA